MKKDLHPTDYRPVVFQDSSNGATFVTQSIAATNETITLEGKEYPLIKVHISSKSHPFFTGEEKIIDIEGRVDKFKARAEAAAKAKEQKQAKAAATAKPAKKAAKKEAPVEEAETPAEEAEEK